MGWTVSIYYPGADGDPEDDVMVDDWGYTFNVGPMLRAAGIDVRGWDGRKAGSIYSDLSAGINELESYPKKYRSMNPDNGWGSMSGVIFLFLSPIAKACWQHPKALVMVS